MVGRARGCLIGVVLFLVLTATFGGIFGPGLVRQAREIYAPISRMKSAEHELEAWTHSQGWHEPATPELTPAQLDRFLSLRQELQKQDADNPRPRRGRGRPRPALEDVPKIVSGVSDVVSQRARAFVRVGMTPAEYRYLENLIYSRWLPPLRLDGQDPAVLEEAARALLAAAESEQESAVAARLRAVAQGLRQRRPEAPTGIPGAVHELLWSRAAAIEALPPTGPSVPFPNVE
jgi:hypothetical protein